MYLETAKKLKNGTKEKKIVKLCNYNEKPMLPCFWKRLMHCLFLKNENENDLIENGHEKVRDLWNTQVRILL